MSGLGTKAVKISEVDMVTPDSDHAASADFPVVAIGASAGGITALQSLFEALPAHPNAAFVVVQHLPPGRLSQLESLIRSWSKLPVHAAGDDVRPEENCIYVPSPDHVLTIEGGVFRTRPIDGGVRRPGIDTIDAFLESLAADQGPRAIAVVLSGTGMDGTAGAVRVRQQGGIVLVQDPITALYDSMPKAVINRSIADYVLSPGAIARQLVACAAPSYVRPDLTGIGSGDVSSSLGRILEFIRQRAGFDLRGYKPSPLLWRIQQRMDTRRAVGFEDYLALLEDDCSELEALVRGIPIHVTEFFRDPDAWEILGRDVLEPLFDEDRNGRPIRVWTPACATGEEAYSIAMLLSEHAGKASKAADYQVFATDASPEILARAGRGVFSESACASLSVQRKAAFFYVADGAYRVKRVLREKMVFAPQDLLADPAFTALDLVTCRNLLIYLEPEAAERVVFMLHSSLRMGGYLFLGKSEALSNRQTGFERVSARWNIYRKVGAIADVALWSPPRPKSNCDAVVPATAHLAAVEHFDLPSVLVDERLQVLWVYGDTNKVLRLPPGQPTHDLLELVQPELVAHVRRSADEALASGRAVTMNGLHDRETGEFALSVRLTPLQTSGDGLPGRLLVSFVRQHDVAEPDDADTAEPREWSEAVRTSHEELEASREELQALNEELKASNEQLNLANEDLNQVNARLEENVSELAMQSRVLSSGAVMTLFLDEELKVRWFTPAVSELIPLLPSDAGRRITVFVPNITDETFIDDIEAVMGSGELRQAEVRHRDGRWFQRGIRPYRSGAKGRTGVAVTFADITARRLAEEALRASEERQAFLLTLSDALRPLADAREIKLTATRILAERLGVNRAFYADADRGHWLVAKGYEEGVKPLPDKPFAMATYGAWIIEDFRAGRRLVVRDMATDARFERSERAAHGALQIAAEVAVPLIKSGELVGMLVVHVDAPRDWSEQDVALIEETAERTWAAVERARVEEALRASEEKYRTLFESIDEGFCIIEVLFEEREKAVDYVFLEVNPSFERQTGIKNAVGRTMREIAPNHEAHWFEIYGRVALSGKPVRFQNRAVELHCFYDVFAFRVDEPQRHRVAIIFNDITARKKAEDALRESEERFRRFVTASADSVYTMSADWSEMRQLVGKEFIATTERPSRTWLGDYIPEDDQPRVMAAIQSAIRGKSNFELEHRVIRLDGTVGWTFSRAVPVPDENGNIVEWLGAARDITAHKQAEDARHEADARLAAVFEASPTPLLVLSPDLRIVAANDAYLNAMMAQRAEIVGKGVFEAFPNNPDEREATGVSNLNASLQRVLATRRADVMAVQKYDIRRPQAEGGGFIERWWSPINTPVLGESGEVTAIIHRVEDVTDIVLLQGERAASDQVLRDQQDLIHRLRRTLDDLTHETEARRRIEAELRECKERLQATRGKRKSS